MLYGLNANAQMWFSEGATWHYSYSNFFIEGYIKLSLVGDTLINEIDTKKVRKSKTTYNFVTEEFQEDVFEGYEYMYSDTDYVYQLINNEFVVLYDFTVIVGDTVALYLDDDYFDPDCDSIGHALVSEIGTEIINGENLRYYILQWIEGSSVILEGKIIEKIGNSEGYLFCTPYCILDEPLRGPFRCYQDNNFGLYSNPSFTNSCDFTIGINENNSPDILIGISPNPVSNDLQIHISKEYLSISQVNVFSLDGKKQLSDYNLSNGNTLDVSKLHPDMYILQVEFENGEKAIRKFIKK